MKKLQVGILSLVLLLSGCSGAKDLAATVGKTKITIPEVQFYLNSVKQQMESTELSSEEDWETSEIEGKKAITLAQERSVQTALDNASYVEVGKKIFGKLNEEERKRSKRMKEQFSAQFSGADGYQNFLKENGLTDQFIEMLCDSSIYSAKLLEKVTEENVNEDACLAYFEENRKSLEETYCRAKHVLILTKDMTTNQPLSEEERAAAKEKAEQIFNTAKGGADFDALVAEFSQDPGSAANPDGYVFREGDMVEEFWDCTNSLAVGEVGFVQSDFGYHVIMRLPLSAETMESTVEELLSGDLLEEKMQNWIEEYGITVEKNNENLDTIS